MHILPNRGFASSKIPLEIQQNPAFARHAAHFSTRIGKHLSAPLTSARIAIRAKRNKEILAAAWADLPPTERTMAIHAQQLAQRRAELDQEGERQFTKFISDKIGELPPVPPLSQWAGASASDTWTAIKYVANAAVEIAKIMSEDELDDLAARCGVPGQHPAARRARLIDQLWLRKAIRREIRLYRETGWYRLAPLQIQRASIDSQLDDRSQIIASENFQKKFGKLRNEKTGEIIQLPDRSTQLKRRNAELTARKKGLSNKAKSLGLHGYIVTFTCASKYHPTTSAGDVRRENARYNRNLDAMDAHLFLAAQFGALGRWAAKNDIPILGMRAVHPHLDGCPHWHLVLLIHPADAPRVEQYIRQRFAELQVSQIDFTELKPLRAGSDSVDAAMSYAAAYLSAAHVENDKSHINIGKDGLEVIGQTDPDLYRAWRRAYGFREFSFFEFGVGKRQRGLVTAWRLLRKRPGAPESIAAAVRSGDWLKFENECRNHSVKLVYKEHVNGFGEVVNKLAGVSLNGDFISAASDWKPLWKRVSEGGAGVSRKESRKPKTKAESPQIITGAAGDSPQAEGRRRPGGRF